MFEQTNNNDLKAFEAKLNALCMYDSERLAAMSALRKGFILVECVAWAAQKISHLAAIWAATPRAATRP
jgi:hypothetical protein